MGEVVLKDRFEKHGLDIEVTSGGTGSWHIGEDANPRTLQVLRDKNYFVDHTARQVDNSWFSETDLFLAMDLSNRNNLLKLAGKKHSHKVLMYRWFDEDLNHLPQDHPDLEVPDPYYGTIKDFEMVLNMVEKAADGFVNKIRQGN
jgi:protein-tyrosine phosphatase